MTRDAVTEPSASTQGQKSESADWSFEEIHSVELEEIGAARRLRQEALKELMPGEDQGHDNGAKKPDRKELLGLAFSGGGIRSATFNLGILQGLADLHLLPRFDYLSTVSGGGYIGSWLAAWIKRDGIKAVLEGLSPRRAGKQGAKPGLSPEAEPIRFLRRFSNYLTPQVGFFSADTWAAAATYLRNLFLNQTVLVLAIAGMLMVPRGAALIVRTTLESVVAGNPRISHLAVILILGAACILLTACAAQIALNMGEIANPRGEQFPEWTKQKAVMVRILMPLLIAACLAVSWIWLCSSWIRHATVINPPPEWIQTLFGKASMPVWWVVGASIVYVIPWAMGWLLTPAASRRIYAARIAPITAVLPGAVCGFLFWKLALLVQSWKGAGGLVHTLSWGPPLMILIILLIAIFHIGLMGSAFDEAQREWWARLGGHLLTVCLGWSALFAASFYAPLALMALGVWVGGKFAGGILGGGWILATLGGVIGGRSEKSGGKNSNRWLELGVQAAPYVFIAGMLMLVSLALFFATARIGSAGNQAGKVWEYIAHGKLSVAPARQEAWNPIYSDADLKIGYVRNVPSASPAISEPLWAAIDETQKWRLIGPALLVIIAVAAGLAWRVDINEFSMHLFYRNRLTRCYLGASNRERRPQPFTGFDAQDDTLLCNLSAFKGNWRSRNGAEVQPPVYSGPYPLINTALNLVKTDNLAWQRRKAASFIFSPRFCGYQESPRLRGTRSPSQEEHAYRVAREYGYFRSGGPLLGTAVAISGAAASPNMGYHSTPALAFLMTVFNVRLGWWMGNPRHKRCWKRSGPRWGLSYLLAELTGNTNDERGYVYLSDGGHFENLGIYELVRRRCRYIVACDGSADPKVTFEDLGNAIQKCRTDFGVDIRIETTSLQRPADSRFCRAHCVVGQIHYGKVVPQGRPPDPGDEPFVGALVYLKTSLTGDEPADVQHYATEHPEFPHESTSDQFFDESQFESYRALGHHAAISSFGILGDSDRLRSMAAADLFTRMAQLWPPPAK